MPTDQLLEVNQTAPSAPLATDLAVSGMTCGNCARHVTEAIQKVSGVRNVLVSLDSRKASVRWDPDHAQNVPALIQAIEAAGYAAKVIEPDSHDHAAHQLAGWQLNLWIGLIGTGILMAGEWLFGL